MTSPITFTSPWSCGGGSGESQMRAYTVRLNPSRFYRAYDITTPCARSES